MNQPVTSDHVPYLPIHLQVGTVPPAQVELDLEALVDTGFDGGISLPRDLLTTPLIPITHHAFKLADATEVMARVYLGHITIGNLPTVETLVITLGDEVLLGRRVIDHFRLVFDHGQSITVEL